MRRVLVAVLVAGLVVAPGAPADAAGSCATPREFRRVDEGQSLREVRRIMGGREYTVYEFGKGRFSRYWFRCGSRERFAQVDFVRGEVVGKRYSS